MGGQSDTVRWGTKGYLVPPSDIGALAERPTHEGRALVRRDGSRESVPDRMESLYGEAIARHGTEGTPAPASGWRTA